LSDTKGFNLPDSLNAARY